MVARCCTLSAIQWQNYLVDDRLQLAFSGVRIMERGLNYVAGDHMHRKASCVPIEPEKRAKEATVHSMNKRFLSIETYETFPLKSHYG